MIGLADVLTAQQVLGRHLWQTPLISSELLSRLSAGDIHLKLESWQRTGSFKVRGALARLASTSNADLAHGIVTSSAGNHGLGLAYAARALNLPSVTIFLPENAPQAKVERLEMTGCALQRAGSDYDTCHAQAVAFARESGAFYLSAYDDLGVIAGQATVGLEIMTARPDIDLLLVPVGGGGLIAGVAITARAINPNVRIIGLQPEASPSAHLSLRDGHPYETFEAAHTICDGLAGGFGRIPFELAASLITDVVVVPEQSVRQAVGWLLAHEQLVVEGSGAIAIAPLLTGQLDVAGRTVAAILTGRNIDAGVLCSILSELDGPDS